MAWSTPRTWVAGELINAVIMNAHVRDQLLEMAPAKVTAAGDIVYATAANAIARLAIGSPGQQLRVNSGGTAPEWANAPNYVIKGSNETVTSSTTLQNDDELFQALGSNQTWVAEFFLYIEQVSSNTPDIKIQIDAPAGATGAWHHAVLDTTGSTNINSTNQFGTSVTDIQLITTTGRYVIPIVAIVSTSGTSGNLQLQWAQNTSDGNGVTVLAGSFLRATRLI